MHFTSVTAAALSMLAMQAQAKTVTVGVGKGGLKFDPDNIKADKGDMIEFHFYPQQHNVVLGNKDKACTPATSGGFYSGTMKVDSGSTGKQVFQVMVNSTDPMYIYCGVAKHCENGMTAIINPKADADVKSWASAAASADASINPSGDAFGGKVADAPAASSSGSMAATGTMAMSGSMSMTASPTSGAAASGSQTKAAGATSSAGAGSLQGQMGGAAAAIAGLAAFVL